MFRNSSDQVPHPIGLCLSQAIVSSSVKRRCSVSMLLFVLSSYLRSSTNQFVSFVRNPGRDISFPIFTRKEIETKRIRKEIKTIISRLNHFLSFLSNI